MFALTHEDPEVGEIHYNVAILCCPNQCGQRLRELKYLLMNCAQCAVPKRSFLVVFTDKIREPLSE